MSTSCGHSQLPVSVRYARGLLYLQGSIWAFLAVSSAATTVVTMGHVLAGHKTWGSFAAEVGWLPALIALTSAVAVTKFTLARRLSARREAIRKTVIAIEIAMTGLGALITAGVDPSGGMPAGVLGLAATVGGGLSLAAAVGLIRRRARQYFANPVLATSAAAGNDDDDAHYSGHLPAAFITRLRRSAHSGVSICQA